MKGPVSSEDSGRREHPVEPERTSRPSREPVDRASLEVKLDALIEEMRVELCAEQAAAAETKGPSVHVSGLLPPASQGTAEADAPKIIVGSGVDPRAEQTIVGRRSPDGAAAWIFDGVEEEATPQGIHAPMTRSDAPVERLVVAEASRRRWAPVVAVAGAAVGVALTWIFVGNVGAVPMLQHVRPGVFPRVQIERIEPPAAATGTTTPAPPPPNDKLARKDPTTTTTTTTTTPKAPWKPTEPRSSLPKPLEPERRF